MAIVEGQQTPLQRVVKIVAALDKVESYRIAVLKGEHDLPYSIAEGATLQQRSETLRRIATLPQRMDRAIENLQALQTRYESEVPEITALYETTQQIEDGYGEKWINQCVYNNMQQVLEDQMQAIFASARPDDAQTPQLTINQQPPITNHVEKQQTSEINHTLVQSYSAEDGLMLTDGTNYRGHRAWIIHELIQRPSDRKITIEEIAESVWGSLNASSRNRANVLLYSVIPILKRLGFEVISEPAPNPRGGKSIKKYGLQPLSKDTQKKMGN